MISKRAIFPLVIFGILFLDSDAIQRSGASRISSLSYSTGNLINGFMQNPGRAILAVIFLILSCGGGILCRMYRCYRNIKRPKSVQSELPYPNSICTNRISKSLINRPNEQNTLEQIQVQQTKSNEENCSIIIPGENDNILPRWKNTSL